MCLACKRAAHRDCLKDVERCSSVPRKLRSGNMFVEIDCMHNLAPRPKFGPALSLGGSSSRPVKASVGADNSEF